MKEWWNALAAKQKGIIGGAAGAVVLALIVLVALLTGNGKHAADPAVLGTDDQGDPIYAAIGAEELDTLRLELDKAGDLIVETEEDGTVIVPTNEDGKPVVVLKKDKDGKVATKTNDAGQLTAQIDQKATKKEAQHYAKEQEQKAKEAAKASKEAEKEAAKASREAEANGGTEAGETTTEREFTGPSNPVPAETAPGTIRTTNGAGEFIQDIVEDQIVTPGPGNLNPEEIKNYEPAPAVVDDNNDEVAENSLKIESAGKYTGVFVENGEDIYLENVASVLVTNTTDRMIQVARFAMVVNGNPEDVAVFQVTDLPAGASALVFELHKRPYTEGEVYTVGDEVHTFYETEDLSDKFSFEVDGDLLTVTNLTDESFDTVYVHYKYTKEGGAYLGGIAYRSTFRSVGPQESVTTSVTHYTDKVSQIVRVDVPASTEAAVEEAAPEE